MKPRLLDAFCCIGGATRGYQQAGFDVTGIDIQVQTDYVGDRFIVADAVQFIYDHGPDFDAIHARGKATMVECQQALGINWCNDRALLVEALPPAYTEYIGHLLMKEIHAHQNDQARQGQMGSRPT